jgi:hypothetical protein
MSDQRDISAELLASEQAIALAQVQLRVLLEIVVWVAFLSVVVIAGFALHSGVDLVGVLVLGAAQTLYDISWWRWLRRAKPEEAYRRLQTREDDFVRTGRQRALLTALTLAAIGVWWFLVR